MITNPDMKPLSATRSKTCRGFNRYWNLRINLYVTVTHRRTSAFTVWHTEKLHDS